MVAVILMRSIFWADDLGTQVQNHIGFPRWLHPAIAGLMLGAIAIFFSYIIGIGYETTSMALTGQLGLHEVIVFAVLKIFAVAITMAGRMGGRGALTGFDDWCAHGISFWIDCDQRFP